MVAIERRAYCLGWLSLALVGFVDAFGLSPRWVAARRREATIKRPTWTIRSSSSTDSEPSLPKQPAPILNGKRVLPFKIMSVGLKGHQIPAVYAVLNSQFERGSEGWKECQFVGVSQDLDETLNTLLEQYGADQVANVRALSFTYPEPSAMQDVANQWRTQVREAGGSLVETDQDGVLKAIEAAIPFEDDDDEEFLEMTAEALGAARESSEATVVSPFESGAETSHESSKQLPFTKEAVDLVLNEVRPYLIADGGNVAVDRVDETKKDVYLTLEGACGSCPSSTVTMQMGIERVLKENFPDLGQVLQTETEDEKPTELTWSSVEEEVNRIKPAIIAMGGVVRIESVDSTTGVVKLEFRGPNKLRQGVELAVQDIPFVNHVEFTMG